MLRFLPRTALKSIVGEKVLSLRASSSQKSHLFDAFPHIPKDRDERLAYFAPEQFTSERFLDWCRCYKQNDFTAPFGKHHSMIADVLKLRGQIVEFLAPREYGKSTFLYAFSDWCRCYGLPHILHVEHNSLIAKRVSVGAGRTALTNTAMIQDYGLSPGPVWKPNGGELIVKNTNPYAMTSESYLRCIGAREIARGTTSTQAERITIAIVNDVVSNYTEAISFSWNNFLEHFLTEDLAYAGGGKRDEDITILFVTTIQATNDISDRLRQNPAVLTYECPAVEGDKQDILNFVEFVSNDIPHIRAAIDAVQGSSEQGFTGENFGREQFAAYCASRPEYQAWFAKLKSTWGVQFPMSRHVSDIFRTSSQAWLQEKMHITGDSKFQRFQSQWFIPYHLEDLPKGEKWFAMCIDWSGDPREGNDPKAIYCGAYHPESTNLYTLGAWCDLATHEETFDKVYELFWECFPWYAGDGVTVHMENIISATGLGLEYFEKLQRLRVSEGGDPSYWIKLPLALFDAKRRGNKLAAITALRPFAEQRRLYYVPGHTHQTLMFQQFLNFAGVQTHRPLPIGQKIDILDTVAMFAHIYGILHNHNMHDGPPIVLESPPRPSPVAPSSLSLISPPMQARRRMVT